MTNVTALFGSQTRYTIDPTPLGKGGMGTVFKALDKKLNRYVAIKVMSAVVTQDVELKRFEREARSMALMQHPHICPIHDFDFVDDHPYMVMDLIEGESLRKVVEGSSLPSTREVAKWIWQVADALNHAHSKGVRHRDIKPENIIINVERNAILMDFGIAQCLGASKTLTSPGGFMGTPAYASPEQIRDTKSVDHRADIYSLGVVLYELLCGRRPYEGSPLEIVKQILNGVRFPPPSIHLNNLDPDLESVCLKAAAFDREVRYQSMNEFASDLEMFLHAESVVRSSATRPRHIKSAPILARESASDTHSETTQSPQTLTHNPALSEYRGSKKSESVPPANPTSPQVSKGLATASAIALLLLALLITYFAMNIDWNPVRSNVGKKDQNADQDALSFDKQVSTLQGLLDRYNNDSTTHSKEIGRLEVEIKNLDELIAQKEESLKKQESEMLALLDTLGDGDGEFVSIGGNKYTAAEVRADLVRREKKYDTASTELRKAKSARESYANRLVFLNERNETVRAEIAQFEADIAELAAAQSTLELQKTAETLNAFDHRLETKAWELKQRIEDRIRLNEILIEKERVEDRIRLNETPSKQPQESPGTNTPSNGLGTPEVDIQNRLREKLKNSDAKKAGHELISIE